MKRVKIWLLLAALCALTPVAAKKLDIQPGPTTMTAEEKAIQADPAAGTEHGVILVSETNWNESRAYNEEVEFHLRAKILSREGLGLADVVIPHNVARGKILQWWGRTILPDGQVLELSQSELQPSTEYEGQSLTYQVLKGALPGVVPGAVIDYGYKINLRSDSISDNSIPLQRAWPVRSFEYSWKPYDKFPASLMVTRGDGLEIGTGRDGNWMRVSARNLPPVPEEDYMPPDREVRATLILYYSSPGAVQKPAAYWKNVANQWDGSVKMFTRKKPLQAAMQEMNLPQEGGPGPKLKKIYDWLSVNIRNDALMSAEEREAAAEVDEKTRNTAAWVLENRTASSFQLDQLFVGFARQVGAEAYLVFAPNRTRNYYNPQYMNSRQFSDLVVAVKLPGEASFTLVDPGSSLPYGQVPWFLTGIDGLLLNRKKPEPIKIPVTPAEQNVQTTRGRMEFGEDNDSILIEWEREGTGQAGFSEHHYLRYLSPKEREERLYRLCGEHGDFEVDTAEAPELGDPNEPFKLICSGESFGAGIGDNIGMYSFGINGAHIPPVPDLIAEERVHPVVLNFPRIDITEMEISAPEGFEPTEAPMTRNIKSPYGDYRLEFARTDDGYTVKRRFELKGLAISPANYGTFHEYLKEVRRADGSAVEFRRTAEGTR
ncbi:hypothetical protein ABI59_03190 [Acidobacteria bacterium Mor1]|nr:hypothetical protein ABI59_03190 [Acidobacteria bacterium Mor1]